MEKLQFFPFLGNLNQTINPKGGKGDFFSVFLSLIEDFNQMGEVKEEEKEISGEKEEAGKNLDINFKISFTHPLIFLVNNVIKEKNTKIDKEINMEEGSKQKNVDVDVIIGKIFGKKGIKIEERNNREETFNVSSNKIINKITRENLEFFGTSNFKEENTAQKKNVLKEKEIVKDEKNLFQQLQQNDKDTLINVKNTLRKNHNSEETFVDFPIRELKKILKRKKRVIIMLRKIHR